MYPAEREGLYGCTGLAMVETISTRYTIIECPQNRRRIKKENCKKIINNYSINLLIFQYLVTGGIGDFTCQSGEI